MSDFIAETVGQLLSDPQAILSACDRWQREAEARLDGKQPTMDSSDFYWLTLALVAYIDHQRMKFGSALVAYESLSGFLRVPSAYVELKDTEDPRNPGRPVLMTYDDYNAATGENLSPYREPTEAELIELNQLYGPAISSISRLELHAKLLIGANFPSPRGIGQHEFPEWLTDLSRNTGKLVQYLWNLRSRTASFQDLRDNVWGDHVDEEAIKKAVARANKQIFEHGYNLSISNRRVKLESLRR